jgi:hypothetical protein
MSRLIPPAKSGGNKRTVDVREVMNGGHVRLEHGLSVARPCPRTFRRRARYMTI